MTTIADRLTARMARRIAAAITKRAVEDLTAERPTFLAATKRQNREARMREWRRKRVSACIWFVSRQSVPWIDGLGYEHDLVLDRVRWCDHARSVLEDKGCRDCMHLEERQFLREVLWRLEKGKAL